MIICHTTRSILKRTDLKILFAKSIYNSKGKHFCFPFLISQLGLNPKSYSIYNRAEEIILSEIIYNLA